MSKEISLGDDANLGGESSSTPPPVDNRHVESRVEDKITRPEGFDENLWDDKTNDVKKDALIKAYQEESKRAKGLRDIIAKGNHKAPESADKYVFEVGDDLKDIVNENNPAIDVFRKAAHAHGLSQEQAKGVLADYVKGLKEGNLLAPGAAPEPTPEELEAEAKIWREGERKKLGDEGVRTLDNLHSAFNAAMKNGSFNDNDKQAYLNSIYNADGVHFVEKLVSLARQGKFGMGNSIPTKEIIAEGLMTREQLDAMGADKEKMRDPEYRRKRTEGYKLLEKKGALS